MKISSKSRRHSSNGKIPLDAEIEFIVSCHANSSEYTLSGDIIFLNELFSRCHRDSPIESAPMQIYSGDNLRMFAKSFFLSDIYSQYHTYFCIER
jgi:hypothetical protein